jgi:hypothetical protein
LIVNYFIFSFSFTNDYFIFILKGLLLSFFFSLTIFFLFSIFKFGKFYKILSNSSSDPSIHKFYNVWIENKLSSKWWSIYNGLFVTSNVISFNYDIIGSIFKWLPWRDKLVKLGNLWSNVIHSAKSLIFLFYIKKY